MIEVISAAVIPLVLLAAAIPMLSRRRDYFGIFVRGARVGLESAVRLLPPMIALTAALSMFGASGAADRLTELLSAPAAFLRIPAEILPLAAARPFSGSAATAEFVRLTDTYGADSFPAFCAAILMGSSDTLFYIVSVYFSAAPSVRRTGHAIPAAMAAVVLGLLLSCAAARIWWR